MEDNRATDRRRRQDEPERHHAARQSADDKDAQAPAAAHVLALQRSAGNQAAARMLARSPLKPPGPVGEITASIEEFNYSSVEEAEAVRELTLGPAASFEGYESEQEAAIAAAGSEQVGVVVGDPEGRFHAYETDVEPIWGPMFSHVIPYQLEAGHVVRWTRLKESRLGPSHEEQIRYARALTVHPLVEKRAEARQLYVGLLESAVGLKPSEIHDSTGGKPAPGKVSFNFAYTSANAHAGVTGAIPSDRKSPLPEPILELGPSAFDDLASLRATLLHEYTHLNHAKQTIAAVERWRATTTEGPFLGWLQRELKAGRIDAIDVAVMKEQVSEQTSNTESLSYLVSFVSSYHVRDLSTFPEDKAGDDVLFGKLDQLSVEWLRADHAVQDHVIAQLVAYRDTLDAAYAERMNAFTAKRFGEYLEESPFRLFWGPLR